MRRADRHPDRIDNACAANAQISAAVFRTSDPNFSFPTAPPSDVPAGVSADVELALSPSATGSHEEIVLISAAIDGSLARYPVSLFGEGQ